MGEQCWGRSRFLPFDKMAQRSLVQRSIWRTAVTGEQRYLVSCGLWLTAVSGAVQLLMDCSG